VGTAAHRGCSLRVLAIIGYPLLVVGMLNLLMTAFLFLGRRREPLRPYAAVGGVLNAACCATVGTAYLLASRGRDYDLFYRAYSIGLVALAPVLQMLFLIQGQPRQARWVGLATYLVFTIFVALSLHDDLIEGGATSLYPFVERLGRYERAARAFASLVILYTLWQMRRAYQVSAGRQRQQTAYLILGMAIYAVAGVFVAGVLPFLSVPIDPALVGFLSLSWVAFTYYAIRRHRLFDIRVVLSRLVDALIVAGLFAGANIGLYRLLAPGFGATSAIVVTSLAVAFAFFMTPLVPLVRRLSDHLLLRRRYDYQQALRDSAQALSARVRVDEVCKQLGQVTREVIGCAGGAVLVREGDTLRVSCASAPSTRDATLSTAGPLVRALGEGARVFVRDEQAGELPEAELAAIDAELGPFGAVVAVPICYRDSMSGLLLLEGKRDRDAYHQVDIDLLETLASQTGIALANARLLEERERSIRVRDDFLAIAGHELRTPLTALQLNVQSLLGPASSADPRLRERLVKTERQVSRLERLTNELLDVSRITAGRLALEREWVDLAVLAHDVAARFSDELRRAGAALELDLPATMLGWCDRMRIEQVLSNLLSNAIKYGEGLPITLRMEAIPDGARIIVQDRGIGIGPDDQARLFGRFERAVSRHYAGGFGVGLWITKQMVEAHGGTITVESAPQQGSRFVVDLPTHAAKA
jgi:signal transduction histidine kinase